MPALRAVIFDLDDTLYPERSFVFSGFRAVADWVQIHLGIQHDHAFAELSRLFEEGVRGNTFNRWLASRGLQSDSLVSQMVQVYREHHPRIAPYPEVPELLQRLRQRYRLGLLSDGYLETQRRKLIALGLATFFDVVVFSDEWGRESWKPSPLPFQVVLERLGITGTEAVYVADNPQKDFVGARQLGIYTVRVCPAEGMYSLVKPYCPEHAPDVDIETLKSLEIVLTEIEDGD